MPALNRISTFRTYQEGTNAPYKSVQYQWTDFVVPPSKANGKVVKLKNGFMFRKATYRSLSHLKLTPGQGFNISGKVSFDGGISRNTTQTSSGGGWSFNDKLFHSFALANKETGINNGVSPPSIPTFAANEAYTKCLLQLANSKANLGESLGTLSQSLKMIGSPTKFVADGIRSVLRDRSLAQWSRYSRRLLRERQIVDESAKRYLEYVYGWKPAMQEIFGLIEYAKEKGDLPLLLHGRGKASRSGHILDVSSVKKKVVTTNIDATCTSRVSCNIYAEIDPNYAGIRALNQLGLLNPAATAWELVTLSFVIDWFVPIGPMLHAWTAPAGLKFVDGSVSNRARISGKFENYYDHNNNGTNALIPATGSLEYNGYRRNPLGSFPIPGFWFDPDPLRGDRPLKAIALMIARMSIR